MRPARALRGRLAMVHVIDNLARLEARPSGWWGGTVAVVEGAFASMAGTCAMSQLMSQ